MNEQDEMKLIRDELRKQFTGYDKTWEGRKAANECTKRTENALRAVASQLDQWPHWEVHVHTPSHLREKQHYAGDCFCVTWEAGPYGWGIQMSYLIMELTGRLVEPYHSFDVCFYEAE